jgi:heme/copper-type cytochrome/quinol oxidase subunit 2
MSAPTAPPPARTQPAPVPARTGRVVELRELSRTTPGVLITFTAALVLVGVLVGVFTAVSVQTRAQALDNLKGSSGPLSDAAQTLYRSLSDADATANSAFLSAGGDPGAVDTLRSRYGQDIAQAEHALAIAVAARTPADLADPDSPLSVLSSKLSVYTGLVETARANNLQGFPVGAAYQREASTLMHDKLLKAARQLYDQETATLEEDQDQASSFPVVELLLGLVALVLLFFAQRYVRRRSRRRLNIGLVVATVAAVISLAWVLVATIGVMTNVDASRENGSDQTKVLADARLAALQARSDETLTLVARGSGSTFEDDYNKNARTPLATQHLPAAQSLATDPDVRSLVRTAIDEEIAWNRTHKDIRTADDGGDYPKAVQLALSDKDAAGQFDRVDTALGTAIKDTTATFEQEVTQAGTALTGTVIGVILLALIMAAGAATGIWQRLKEYR